MEAKHGWLAGFFYEPWLLQIVLCARWILTWWISFALHTNVTAILQERCLQEITKHWHESCASQSRPRLARICSTFFKRKVISKAQRNAELQRWLQRKKGRREHARNLSNNVCLRKLLCKRAACILVSSNLTTNVCLRKHLYKTAAGSWISSSSMLHGARSHSIRGGGSGTKKQTTSKQ